MRTFIFVLFAVLLSFSAVAQDAVVEEAEVVEAVTKVHRAAVALEIAECGLEKAVKKLDNTCILEAVARPMTWQDAVDLAFEAVADDFIDYTQAKNTITFTKLSTNVEAPAVKCDCAASCGNEDCNIYPPEPSDSQTRTCKGKCDGPHCGKCSWGPATPTDPETPTDLADWIWE